MPKIDDQLPSDEIDFTQYLRKMAQSGITAQNIRATFRSNLKLRSIVAGLPEIDQRSRDAEELLEIGIAATEKIAADPSVDLGVNERLGTEAVVRLTERPALLVKNDSFGIPPERWTRLDVPFRPDIERQLPQIGRIDIGPADNRTMIGTAFVVSNDLVMTNTHVVEVFADPTPDFSRWEFKANANPTIDFKAEHDVLTRKIFTITKVVLAHDRESPDRMKSLDLALLQVEPLAIDPPGAALPRPLALSKTAPSDDGDNDLYLVGYPWTDNEGVVPEQVMMDIFGGIYQAKRLQPGEYRAAFDDFMAFSHDCSTLGGNSGSCVMDLQTSQVIGLHFKGLYKRANYAIQMWRLQEKLSAFGLNWI